MVIIQNIREKIRSDSQSFYDLKNDLLNNIYPDGTEFWYNNGKLHRENDLPAAIYSDGRREWYKNSKRHRDVDLPAIINANGSKFWYKNGKFIKDLNNDIHLRC